MKHWEDETHSICRSKLEIFGGNGECCFCKPHENCLLMEITNEVPIVKTKTRKQMEEEIINDKKDLLIKILAHAESMEMAKDVRHYIKDEILKL